MASLCAFVHYGILSFNFSISAPHTKSHLRHICTVGGFISFRLIEVRVKNCAPPVAMSINFVPSQADYFYALAIFPGWIWRNFFLRYKIFPLCVSRIGVSWNAQQASSRVPSFLLRPLSSLSGLRHTV